MRFKEQKLWDRMRKNLRGKALMERVENLVGVGRPDVDVLCEGKFTPVELKAVVAFPKRESTRVLGLAGLSQDQKNWHLEWRNHGGASLILISVGCELFAVPGTFADEVNDMIRDALEEFKTDWDGLCDILRGDQP